MSEEAVKNERGVVGWVERRGDAWAFARKSGMSMGGTKFWVTLPGLDREEAERCLREPLEAFKLLVHLRASANFVCLDGHTATAVVGRDDVPALVRLIDLCAAEGLIERAPPEEKLDAEAHRGMMVRAEVTGTLGHNFVISPPFRHL